MASKLAGLKAVSQVVADTGDLDAIRTYRPHDATTNPSLLLKAFELDAYQDLIEGTLADARETRPSGDRAGALEHAVDCLSVAVGAAIAREVPGHVSTEVAAKLSFDAEASKAKARKLVTMYEARGITRDKVLIKLAATWEGIRAAEQLQAEGIDCNLTLLFSDAQARACFEAGVFLVSPFVGRVTDWYKQVTGANSYAPDDDPGVIFVRGVCDYADRYGYKTVVMGASFRNTGQILALAGASRLTISPALLEELATDEGGIARRIEASGGAERPPEPLSEAVFRWQHNEDAMATEKLAEGIRRFAADQADLERLIETRWS